MKPNFSRERTYFSLELSLYVIPSGAKSRNLGEYRTVWSAGCLDLARHDNPFQ
jgi:hypothetical protein